MQSPQGGNHGGEHVLVLFRFERRQQHRHDRWHAERAQPARSRHPHLGSGVAQHGSGEVQHCVDVESRTLEGKHPDRGVGVHHAGSHGSHGDFATQGHEPYQRSSSHGRVGRSPEVAEEVAHLDGARAQLGVDLAPQGSKLGLASDDPRVRGVHLEDLPERVRRVLSSPLQPLELCQLHEHPGMERRDADLIPQLLEASRGLGTHAQVPHQAGPGQTQPAVRGASLQRSLHRCKCIVVSLPPGKGSSELQRSLLRVRASGQFLPDDPLPRVLDRFPGGLLADLSPRLQQARGNRSHLPGRPRLCHTAQGRADQQQGQNASHGPLVPSATTVDPCFPMRHEEPAAMAARALGPTRLRRLRSQLCDLVAEAGRRVRARSSGLRRADVRRKGPGDFVTAVDLAIERWLRSELGAMLPGAGFLGEETTSAGLEQGLVWCVDPIDGTSNFAHGLTQYAVAIALLHRRRPVVAAVWVAPQGDVLAAAAGCGATRNGRVLRIPVGRADDAAIHGAQWFRGTGDLRFLAALQADGARIRTFGSTVVQLMDVACGRLDANVQQQGRIWDVAAPGLILVEAGGKFTDWGGKPVFPFPSLQVEHTATLAASAPVHRALRSALAGAGLVEGKSFRRSNTRH